MPQGSAALAIAKVAVPAVVGAGATIFGAKKGASAAKDAQKAQLAANAEALAYQREQDAKAEARQAEIDARERELEAKAEAAWNAEQERVAPLRALKEMLAGQAAGRIGLPFNTSGLGDAKPYPGAGASVAPLSALSASRGTGVIGKPASVSAAIPDPAGLSEEDPYTTSSLRLADIARGGWRL